MALALSLSLSGSGSGYVKLSYLNRIIYVKVGNKSLDAHGSGYSKAQLCGPHDKCIGYIKLRYKSSK